MKPDFIEIESLKMNTPSATDLRKGVKRKCIGKDIISINTEMLVSFAPGSEIELDNEIFSTTDIFLMDETFHTIPVNYLKFKEELRNLRN